MSEVRCDVTGHVARIILSNPAKYNAMTYAMWQQLITILMHIDQLDTTTLRIVTIEGDGARAFSSGADISEFEQLRNTPEQVAHYDQTAEHAMALLRQCRFPVIAIIRGLCIGGGMAIASMADMRYCHQSVHFKMPAARVGVGYDYEGTKRLAELVGTAHAAELFFVAHSFDGVEAQRIGLVNRAYADDVFEKEVSKVIDQISVNAPLPMIAAKYALGEMAKNPEERDLKKAAQLVQNCFDSQDFKEGRQAFLEKRKPQFTGK